MTGENNYGAVVTKVRAMSAKLLDAEDYQQMSVMKSIPELIAFLGGKESYKGVFTTLKTSEINRDKLEQILNTTLYRDYLKILHYLNNEDTAFCKCYMYKYEINIVKNMIRQVMSGEVFRLEFESDDFFNMSSFKKIRIESVKNIDEVTRAIHETPYYEPLNALLKREKQPTLFEIETALDHFYFTELWRERENVSPENRAVIEECVGTEADLYNILWIYRSKKYFKVKDKYVYSYLIPVHYKLDADMIKKLTLSENTAKMRENLEKTPYDGALGNSAHMFERAMLDFVMKDIGRRVKKGEQNISAVLWYLHAKELELGNICSVAEGVRYSLRPAEIMNYVFIK